LTPHEVGLMLRALGFGNDTYLYVASGEIYGGEETLKPLMELFPNFYTKEMLVGDDLKPFLPFSSRLAAIDFIVCDESDVFVTNNNGNMAKVLAGRRYGLLFFADVLKYNFLEYCCCGFALSVGLECFLCVISSFRACSYSFSFTLYLIC
jgi:hypothetical protein